RSEPTSTPVATSARARSSSTPSPSQGTRSLAAVVRAVAPTAADAQVRKQAGSGRAGGDRSAFAPSASRKSRKIALRFRLRRINFARRERGSALAKARTAQKPDYLSLTLAALEAGDPARVRELFADMHPADIATVLEGIPPESRETVWQQVEVAK